MEAEITGRTFEGIEFIDTRIAHNVTGFDALPKAMAAANTMIPRARAPNGRPATTPPGSGSALGAAIRLALWQPPCRFPWRSRP